MSILEIKNLTKHYGSEPAVIKALDDVTVSVNNQAFVAVVGASGSGKSTLLHMMGGLDMPTSGSVFVMGKDITKMEERELTKFRRRNIGFVFQSYNLVPVLNVYDNIILPMVFDDGKVDKPFVNNIVETLGITNRLQALPNTLSGGEQQRVAIARALVMKPAILLADEPTGNLDSKTSQDVLNVFKTSAAEFSQTIIMITHNEQIAQLANRTLYIKDGRLV